MPIRCEIKLSTLTKDLQLRRPRLPEVAQVAEPELPFFPLSLNKKSLAKAAVGGDPANGRDVDVFRADTAMNPPREIVIKVGHTKDSAAHGGPFPRAKKELTESQGFEQTALAKHVVPTRPFLMSGSDGKPTDARVQSQFVKGTELSEINLVCLGVNQLTALIDYHKALMDTFLSIGWMPEGGWELRKDTVSARVVSSIIRRLPLMSRNAMLDDDGQHVYVIDTGSPLTLDDKRGLSKAAFAMLTMTAIGLELGLLSLAREAVKVKNRLGK